jgi:MYXO-CTERM domain-containing protein
MPTWKRRRPFACLSFCEKNLSDIMTTKTTIASFAFLLVLPLGAATTFSNTLTGFSGDSQTNRPSQPITLAGSGLNVSFVWADGDGAWEKIDFTPLGASFGNHQGGDNGRNYMRTNDTDYAATVGFIAYVDINRPTRESVFFGMGTGALGGSKQPDVNSGNAAVYLELQGGFDNASRRILGGTSGSPTNVEDGYTGMTTITGPMRLSMSYDGGAQEITFAVDYNPSGAFVADQTFATVPLSSIAGEWSGGEASSIFFGGEDGVTFSNLQVTVVPEPSAVLLGSLGMLGLLRRRRH